MFLQKSDKFLFISNSHNIYKVISESYDQALCRKMPHIHSFVLAQNGYWENVLQLEEIKYAHISIK